jgi:glycosyltransferase involved in cell wall biosynthesis
VTDGARSLLSCGWRFIPQSYAVAAQFECLDILRRGSACRLYFEDLPYYDPSWKPVEGLFDPAQERLLRSIPQLPAGMAPDAELRRVVPFDFSRPPRAAHAAVWGTAEALTLPTQFIAGGLPAREAQRRHGMSVITPSNWSKEGFVRGGVPEEKVCVVPLGFDPAIFRPPTAAEREEARARLGFGRDDFVFYHAGVMTTNKGVQFLLPAFAQACAMRPQVKLLLKGSDALYRSKQFLENSLGELERGAVDSILSRIVYTGETMSFAGMAALYHAADCYISPYIAEGFAMPVLEAAACGLPVICTAGGPTDDFVADEFALRIESTRQELVAFDTGGAPVGVGVIPDLDHLVHLMLCAIDDAEFREAARKAAPQFVSAFTWSRVTDRLLEFLFSGR